MKIKYIPYVIFGFISFWASLLASSQSYKYENVYFSEDGNIFIPTTSSVEIEGPSNGYYSIILDIPPEKPHLSVVKFDSKEIVDGQEWFFYLVDGSPARGAAGYSAFIFDKEIKKLINREGGILIWVIANKDYSSGQYVYFKLIDNNGPLVSSNSKDISVDNKEHQAPNLVDPGESNVVKRDGKIILGENVTAADGESHEAIKSTRPEDNRIDADPNREEYLNKIKDGRLDRNAPVSTMKTRNSYREEGSEGNTFNLLEEIELYFSQKERK